MTIGTYQQFYTIIKNDLPAISLPLGECINAVARICACKKQEKQNKSNQCDDIYVTFIKNNGEKLKEYFTTKTQDGEIIFNHELHHPIIRLKLR